MLVAVAVDLSLVPQRQEELVEEALEATSLLTELMRLQLTEVVEAVELDPEQVMVVPVLLF